MKTTSLALLGLLATVLGGAAAAPAAEIQVTMKEDVVANDGRCSLREAIDAANTDSRSGSKAGECIAGQKLPAVDVILLRRGTYRLKRGAAGDDLNVGGDLDVTESVVIQGKGQRGTVIQNGVGDPAVAGDGDRLFDVDPGSAGGVDVTFSKLTLARGDVSCTGASCDPGASAVESSGSGTLVFEDCMVMRNAASCTGDGCGTRVGGAAIASTQGGSVAIRGTTIKKNESSCATPGCSAGPAAIAMVVGGGVVVGLAPPDAEQGDFTLDDSTVTQNVTRCTGDECNTSGVVGIEASTIAVRAVDVTLNATRCEGLDCGAYDVFGAYAALSTTIEDVEVGDNVSECKGIDCFAGGALYASGASSSSLRGVNLAHNWGTCEGSDCYLASGLYASAGSTVVQDLEAITGTLFCSGEDCEVEPLVQARADGTVDVVDVKLDGNEIGCEGEDCAAGAVAWWFGNSFRTLRTEVTANHGACTGDECRLLPLLAADAVADSTVGEQVVNGNHGLCSGFHCLTGDMIDLFVDEGDLALTAQTIEANSLACEGEGCVSADFLDVVVDGAFTFDGARVASNSVGCRGVVCRSGSVGALQSFDLELVDALVLGNSTYCVGDGCRGEAALRLLGLAGEVKLSRFEENRVTCAGEDAATGTGGALRNQMSRLTISGSELWANETDGSGGAIFNGAGSELILDQVSILENEAGLNAVMEFGGFGGGIFNDASNGQRGVLTISNSEIRRNRSLRNGGGVLNEGVIARLVQSTLSDNDPSQCTNQGTGATGCP